MKPLTIGASYTVSYRDGTFDLVFVEIKAGDVGKMIRDPGFGPAATMISVKHFGIPVYETTEQIIDYLKEGKR